MSTDLKVQFGGCSIAGIKPENQDAFAAHLPEAHLLKHKGMAAALADGVSSSDQSHIASQTSVTHFLDDYFSTPESWTVKSSAAKVLQALNGWLFQHGNSGARARNSLVTTFSALVIKSTTVHLFHVGDSRIYRLRGGHLEQLTRDHSSTYGGTKSYLTRALGVDSHLEVDYHREPVAAGDLYLLSSDGLHEFLGFQQLQEKLDAVGDSLETEARELVQAALDAGSDDNISALLVRVCELPTEELEEAHRKLTELPIPPALVAGNRIDGYEVQDVLFSGTRSHLYLVRDEEGGELYVLKTPSLNFADDPLYLDGFIREEWVGKRIKHPGVMRVFAPKREKNFLYYLSEYIQGKSLRDWIIENPRPSLDQVRDLVEQIAKALRAFQRMDMLHQDLKPENILIDRQQRIKIIDFGTVRVAGIEEMARPLELEVPQGSVNYVAPEYLMGEAGSHRSDLFSLGVICYELLTGRLPYKERPASNYQIRQYSELKYIPARSHREDIPDWVEGALHSACAADPTRRYPALSEFLHDLSKPNRRYQREAQQRPLIERNPLLFWKILCGVLLCLQIVQWILMQR